MSDFPFSDEELKLAAKKVCLSMLDSLNEPEDYNPAFSSSFLSKMERLCRKTRKSRSFRVLSYRAAAIVLALLFGLGIFFATNTEARAEVVRWAKETWEQSVFYRFFGSKTTAELPYYALRWIPDGFELESESRTETSTFIFYRNDETGQTISLEYELVSDDIQAEIFASDGISEPEKVFINGLCADYYPASGDIMLSNLIWLDQTQSVVFFLDSELDIDVMLHIAEQITLADST